MVSIADMRRDPRLADPFLTPNWRYQRVIKMISQTPMPKRTTRRDDRYIKEARSFLLRWRKGNDERERLREEQPELFHAWSLFDRIPQDPEFSLTLEARLLADQPVDEIAQAIKILPETVDWYERLFFNVKPFLDNHDWILKHVLLPATDRMAALDADAGDNMFKTPVIIRPHLDMTLKFFSYYGGPLICEYMMAGFKRGLKCHTQDEIGKWLNEGFMLQIQRRSAEAAPRFEVNRYNVMELFITHMQIIQVQHSLEGQEERHSTVEKHIHGMLKEIPWTVGRDARELFAGTVIGETDEMAAELNAEELMLIGAGQYVPALGEVPDMVITARAVEKHKERTDANS
jgi:hypothetical protein